MKAKLPHPDHYSFLQHRRQRSMQIILPVAISTIMVVGLVFLISFTAFKSDGDVGRWAAISTIWIVIPVFLAGLITLAVLCGLIYLMARALSALPNYTAIAQDYVYIAKAYIMRGADQVVHPVIAINGFIEDIKAFMGRMGTL